MSQTTTTQIVSVAPAVDAHKLLTMLLDDAHELKGMKVEINGDYSQEDLAAWDVRLKQSAELVKTLTSGETTAAVPVFFVQGETEDGESLDLLVGADDIGGAQAGWRQHYQLAEDASPKRVAIMQGLTAAMKGPVSWEG